MAGTIGSGLGSLLDNIPGKGVGSGFGALLDSVPGKGVGSGLGAVLEVRFVGIPAKQLRLDSAGGLQADGSNGGLEVKPDTTSVQTISVDANGVKISTAAAGNGLTGGGTSALTVQAVANKGITVGASGVQIDESNASTAVSISAGTWTFTKDTLQVTGTPDSANDPVNKTYVDSLISGLTWAAPVSVKEMIGSDAALDIEGFSPLAGDAYVIDTANGAGALSSATVGDVWEYSGSAWVKIITGSGGFVPSGFRALASIQTALNGSIGLTDGVDDGKFLDWDGTSLTPSLETPPTDGNAVLVTEHVSSDNPSLYDNLGYVFEGTVPTGTWVQFTGAGTINAGTGLTKSGSTLNVGDAGKGVQVNADDLEVDGSEIAGLGLTQNGSNSWKVDIEPNVTDGGAQPGLEVGANGVRISTGAAGNGLTGGGGSALAVQPNNTDGGGISGLETAANGVRIATTAAGNGLTGGGGSALSVQPNTTDGGAQPGLEVAANGVRISTGAAGAGLTGGGGSALAVGAGNGITVTADAVSVNPAQLITGGAAEIDGDKLDIDWNPSNYTPSTNPAEADSVDNLTAHLYGIDQALAAAGGTAYQESVTTQNITGTDTVVTDTLNNTPLSNATVRLFLNGILQEQGTGKDYTISGATITWLASSGTAVDMDTNDVLVACYSA